MRRHRHWPTIRAGFNHYYGVRSAATLSPSRVLFHLRLPPFCPQLDPIAFVYSRSNIFPIEDHDDPTNRCLTASKRIEPRRSTDTDLNATLPRANLDVTCLRHGAGRGEKSAAWSEESHGLALGKLGLSIVCT